MCAGPGTPEILPTGKEVLIEVLEAPVLTTVLWYLWKETMEVRKRVGSLPFIFKCRWVRTLLSKLEEVT